MDDLNNRMDFIKLSEDEFAGVDVLRTFDECERYLATMDLNHSFMPANPLEIGSRRVELDESVLKSLIDFKPELLLEVGAVPVLHKNASDKFYRVFWMYAFSYERGSRYLKTTCGSLEYHDTDSMKVLNYKKILDMRRMYFIGTGGHSVKEVKSFS